MAKKNKKQKEIPQSDNRVAELQAMYDNGNFGDVRAKSSELQSDTNLGEEDIALVQRLAETVQIDPMALYAGLASLVFISLIALLSLSAS